MKHAIASSLLALTLLAACSQQQQVNVVDNRNNFYGRNGWYADGQAVARYSDYNRADQGDIAYKYKSTTHTYGVDAAVQQVATRDLAPPTAVAAQAQPASGTPFTKASLVSAEPKLATATKPIVTEPELAASKPAAAPINGANLGFRWPVDGKVISRFGPKTDGLSNDGINIAAAKGDPIWAAADGEVVYVGSDLQGYGNLMILRHREGWMSSYAHADEFLLKKGDTVAQGDMLGYVGTSGSVKSPQLHFSLREGKIPIDPESVLNQQVASAPAQ